MILQISKFRGWFDVMGSIHSKESNTILYQTAICQNWCIFSRDDKYIKFSFFSELYDGSIFETSELKTELPELQNCWGPAWKFEKSRFSGPVLQGEISSKTSILCFRVKKLTLLQISTYMNGAQNGAPGALGLKIASKIN